MEGVLFTLGSIAVCTILMFNIGKIMDFFSRKEEEIGKLKSEKEKVTADDFKGNILIKEIECSRRENNNRFFQLLSFSGLSKYVDNTITINLADENSTVNQVLFFYEYQAYITEALFLLMDTHNQSLSEKDCADFTEYLALVKRQMEDLENKLDALTIEKESYTRWEEYSKIRGWYDRDESEERLIDLLVNALSFWAQRNGIDKISSYEASLRQLARDFFEEQKNIFSKYSISRKEDMERDITIPSSDSEDNPEKVELETIMKELSAYKQMLDQGLITVADYNREKDSLLGLGEIGIHDSKSMHSKIDFPHLLDVSFIWLQILFIILAVFLLCVGSFHEACWDDPFCIFGLVVLFDGISLFFTKRAKKKKKILNIVFSIIMQFAIWITLIWECSFGKYTLIDYSLSFLFFVSFISTILAIVVIAINMKKE